MVRIEERIVSEREHRFHGIQLMFSNGDGADTLTPFYRGMDTDEEMKIVDVEIYCCGNVAGIQVE